ncbi:GNAT family N-acetyltransferase [Candidatus Poribacteria bacterium]|nr:GNAT family N-acetyltransferase [Candidatus Poribacteria bacterium]
MSIDIIPVQSPSDLRGFIDLPWQLYRGDPNWVPLLRSDLKKRLDRSRYPFFEHAQAEFFIARRDESIIGRIVAIKNDNYIAFHEEPVGFFGFFECIQDAEVAAGLFSHAADWLRARSLKVMRGPMNYSINEECGLLVDGFDDPPVIMMPYNPRYYIDLIEGFGFQKAKDLLAYEITDEVHLSDRLVRTVETIKRRKKITIRPLVKKQINQEVQRVKDIYNSAWEKNWGFLPMTDREIDQMAKELIQIVDPDLVLFAEVEGEPVAFILALPDFYRALKHANGRLFPFGLLKILWHARKIDVARVLVFGIKEAYRRQGIDALLYYEVYKRGVEKGYRRGELSWILEDNKLMNRAIENMGAKVYKRYRIYDYPL